MYSPAVNVYMYSIAAWSQGLKHYTEPLTLGRRWWRCWGHPVRWHSRNSHHGHKVRVHGWGWGRRCVHHACWARRRGWWRRWGTRWKWRLDPRRRRHHRRGAHGWRGLSGWGSCLLRLLPGWQVSSGRGGCGSCICKRRNPIWHFCCTTTKWQEIGGQFNKLCNVFITKIYL